MARPRRTHSIDKCTTDHGVVKPRPLTELAALSTAGSRSFSRLASARDGVLPVVTTELAVLSQAYQLHAAFCRPTTIRASVARTLHGSQVTRLARCLRPDPLLSTPVAATSVPAPSRTCDLSRVRHAVVPLSQPRFSAGLSRLSRLVVYPTFNEIGRRVAIAYPRVDGACVGICRRSFASGRRVPSSHRICRLPSQLGC